MKSMYGLGIDAGGTYTDTVILDFANGKVVTFAKALTTRPDPSIGIRKALTKISVDFLRHVSIVSLATTFATNAIVEDQGAEAGLILIGYSELPPDIPNATHVLMVRGGHTVSGEEKAPLDCKALQENLDAFLEGLDAVAISGFFSVRNPDHELKAARLVHQKRHDLPVVLGRQLSMRLDAMKRATTAWWNARLIPLIHSLIKAANKVLLEMGIPASLMVVRGDGTLMSASTALDRPIDTLLSGPAASIVGAKQLTGIENALIVDIGSTTTDTAFLVNGRVAIDPEGAHVGRWRTCVEAAKVRTIGVGGDSLISVDDEGHFLIGPLRVMPLCILAERDPKILKILKMILQRISKVPYRGVIPCSFYVKAYPQSFTGRTILDYMKSGPVSEFLLLENLDYRSSIQKLKRYERDGLVFRSSLTPTDIRVATGRFHLGNEESAQLGLAIFARYIGMSESRFAEAVEEGIRKRLCMETISFVSDTDTEALSWLRHLWFREKLSHKSGVNLDVRMRLTTPVIGVGAPAAAYLPMIFRQLNTECILPKAFSVAGAVGAIAGIVSVTLIGRIRSTDSGGYSLYTPTGKKTFKTLNQALDRGRILLKDLVRDQMYQNNVAEPTIDFSIEDKKITMGRGGEIHLETVLRVQATGRPNVG